MLIIWLAGPHDLIQTNQHSAMWYARPAGWLVGCLTARQHIICATCDGGKPAQSAKDGQQDTMNTTLRYTITM